MDVSKLLTDKKINVSTVNESSPALRMTKEISTTVSLSIKVFFLLLEKRWQKFSQGYKIYIKLVVQGARCDGMIE